MSEHRLIYADELIKVFEQYLDKIGYEGESISKSARTSLMKWVIYKTNEQPTAHDIDKVVERLKKESWSLGSDDVIEHYCVDLVDAIEIVKAEQEEGAE